MERKSDIASGTPTLGRYSLTDGSALARTGGFTLDPSDRLQSRAFYNSVFKSSEGTPDQWNGDHALCQSGTTSVAFQRAVLVRINYFRAMAGVPAEVTFLEAYNRKAQQAALMMSANDTLSHAPHQAWACYSDEGSEAARKSNLSFGTYGWEAVLGQMRDNGPNNGPVGHRRWLLYPQTLQMGTGDVPGGEFRYPANAVWVQDQRLWSPRPTTRDVFVAWPPPGFVPYQVVFPRWSFSYPDADFSHARVTMTQGEVVVPVRLEPYQAFLGESTLVWVADGMDPDVYGSGWERPVEDTTYGVKVENVVIGDVTRSFAYQVTVIDPSTRAIDEAIPTVTGPRDISINEVVSYRFEAVPLAIDHEVLHASLRSYFETEGAERGPDGIVDETDPSYELISFQDRASGSAAFHLAHPQPSHQAFTLAPSLLLTDRSELRFAKRLGWSSMDQVARAQLLLGDGSLVDLYTEAGRDNAGDAGYSNVRVDLSGYADQVARIRFAYDLEGSTYYPQTVSAVGFHVDDIEVTQAFEVQDPEITAIGNAGEFQFLTGTAGMYLFLVRAIGWEGFPALDWGWAFRFQAQ